jgi:hypothetical protein
MSESPQEMAARAEAVFLGCRNSGMASLAGMALLNDFVHDLADDLDDANAEIAELAGDVADLAEEYSGSDRMLEDARALAQALLDRLRDFIDDETAFGDGMSWATLPDWISGDETGRDMWNYGADDEAIDAAKTALTRLPIEGA